MAIRVLRAPLPTAQLQQPALGCGCWAQPKPVTYAAEAVERHCALATVAAGFPLWARRRSRRHLWQRRWICRRSGPDSNRRVLLLDPCAPGVTERLNGLGCEVFERGSGEGVVTALGRSRPTIIIVRSSLLQEDELKAAGLEELQLIMRAGAGVDNIAVAGFAARGVLVANAAGANAVAVAELTMAHLLNLDRRLCDQATSLRAGQWRRLQFAKGSRGLYGSTLAVLGLGSIGREVVVRAKAFGMKVRAWSRSLTQEQASRLGVVGCSDPSAAVDGAHAVTVHLPLSTETRGVVGKEIFMKMAPGALFVNMSRGGVVDEDALLWAVQERGLRAGLDVFANEPGASGQVFEDTKILSCENIYGTHHTGARTEQAAQAIEEAVVAAVSAFLSGQPVPGLVSQGLE